MPSYNGSPDSKGNQGTGPFPGFPCLLGPVGYRGAETEMECAFCKRRAHGKTHACGPSGAVEQRRTSHGPSRGHGRAAGALPMQEGKAIKRSKAKQPARSKPNVGLR